MVALVGVKTRNIRKCIVLLYALVSEIGMS